MFWLLSILNSKAPLPKFPERNTHPKGVSSKAAPAQHVDQASLRAASYVTWGHKGSFLGGGWSTTSLPNSLEVTNFLNYIISMIVIYVKTLITWMSSQKWLTMALQDCMKWNFRHSSASCVLFPAGRFMWLQGAPWCLQAPRWWLLMSTNRN